MILPIYRSAAVHAPPPALRATRLEWHLDRVKKRT